MLVAVSAPDSEETSGTDPTLYYNWPPRFRAARTEQFEIGLSRETLNKFHLSDGATSREGVAAYRRARTDEVELAAGVVDFHLAEVEQDAADKETIRAELLETVATNPATVALPGEVMQDGDVIKDKAEQVVVQSLAKANNHINAGRGVPVNLYLTAEDRERLDTYFQNAVDGIATIPEAEIKPILFRGRGADNPAALLIHENPIAKFCSEQSFEEKCARLHTGMDPDGDDHHHGGDSDGDGGSEGGGAGDESHRLNDDDVARYLTRLLKKAPSPDSVLSPALGAQRPDQDTIDASVDQFALRRGPADVPRFYDFTSLDIAFDHVWRILIDEDLVSAGHSLEKKFRQKTGTALSARFPRNWTDLSWANNVYTAIPQEVPAEVAAQFDITLEEWTDLSAAHQTKLTEIARDLVRTTVEKVRVSLPGIGSVEVPRSQLGTLAVERRRQDLREQGERLIDSVRHDDYYTMHKTLRDLHDRMNGNYEFTVFAADKNDQCVNFGLMNTFRIMMTPINYQAGKLVKTLPMAPKEERKYSVKVTRNLKQAQKEAVKNNSSLTYEQTSTSRVEAEIMHKAQNKTNFSLSTDGRTTSVSRRARPRRRSASKLNRKAQRAARTFASRCSRRCRTTKKNARSRSPQKTPAATNTTRAAPSSTRTTSCR